MTSNTKKMAATARPHTEENLDESYLEMASDEIAEEEALEWSEALIRDVGNEIARSNYWEV